MTVLRPHEAEVVRLLAGRHLSPDVLEDVVSTAVFVELDETGCGYFLTLRHPALPKNRVVCNEPLVVGRTDDLACGFVLFLEDGLLTLECHSWGDATIPVGFRDQDVKISPAT